MQKVYSSLQRKHGGYLYSLTALLFYVVSSEDSLKGFEPQLIGTKICIRKANVDMLIG